MIGILTRPKLIAPFQIGLIRFQEKDLLEIILLEEQLQQLLRKFPDADLNKDGKLTVDEFREFYRKKQGGGAAAPASPSAPVPAPASAATNAAAAGPVAIRITSDKAVPINPRCIPASAPDRR